VENGEIAYPVNEVTIAGSLPEMFERMAAIGSDVDVRGTIRTGTVVVDGLTVAGQ
jgi:PmbA protein